MKRTFLERLLAFLLVVCMVIPMLPAITLPAKAATDPIVVVAGSDFQASGGAAASATNVKNLLTSIKNNGGYSKVDGFLFAGDYSNSWYEDTTTEGVTALKEAVNAVYPGLGTSDGAVYVQGNHDPTVCVTDGTLTKSGANDTQNYGVFVINEDDFQWSGDSTVERVTATATSLRGYMNSKISRAYTKPIFVVSHVPLHYTMRTRQNGDSRYADILFEVLQHAGEAGLNIIFMYGHNHSATWEDSHGGSAVFYNKGDTINIAQSSQTVLKEETLNFTYMNAGYVGYYSTGNTGVHQTLNMSVFEITDDQVTISRFDANGPHAYLKAAGVSNTYYTTHTESDYFAPKTNTVTSPKTITLNKTIDTSMVTGVTVSGTGITDSQVIYCDSDLPTGYNYYQTYDIKATGHTAGTAATVSVPLDSAIDANRPVFVIDHEKNATIPAEIADGAVSFTTDHFSFYTVAQMEETVVTSEVPGTLGNTLVTVLTGEGLEQGIPYIITEATKEGSYQWMVTGDSATKASVGTGLFIEGYGDPDTAHVWYFDGTYIRYGSATGKYMIINTNNVALSDTLDTSAAAIPVQLSNSRRFNFQRADKTDVYLNRHGGTATDNVALTFNSSYYSRWYVHKVVTGGKVSAKITTSQTVMPLDGSIQLMASAVLDFSASNVPDTASSESSNVEVVWHSCDTSIATVDANGLVTPVAPGQAYIRATIKSVDGVNTTTNTFAEILITVEEITESDNGITATTHYGASAGSSLLIDLESTEKSGPYYIREYYNKWYLSGNELVKTDEGYYGAANYDGVEMLSHAPLYEKDVWYLDANGLCLGGDENKYLQYDGSRLIVGPIVEGNDVFRVKFHNSYTNGYHIYYIGGDNGNTVWRTGKPYNVASRTGQTNQGYWQLREYIPGQEVSLTILPPDAFLYEGTQLNFTKTLIAGGTPKADYTIEWISTDNSIATVDANGIVTTVCAGEAVIVAKLTHIDGVKLTAPLYVDVPIEVVADSESTEYSKLNTQTEEFLVAVTNPQPDVPYVVTSYSNADWVLSNVAKSASGDSSYSGFELIPYEEAGTEHVWYFVTETDADGVEKQYLRYGNLTDSNNYLSVDPDNSKKAVLGPKDQYAYDEWTTNDNGKTWYPRVTATNNFLNQHGGKNKDAAVACTDWGTSSGSSWRFYRVDASKDLAFQVYTDEYGSYGVTTVEETLQLNRVLSFDGTIKRQSDYAVTYQLSDPSVATIDRDGVLHPRKAGKVTVKATLAWVSHNGTTYTYDYGSVKTASYEVYIPVTIHGVSSVTLNTQEGALPLRASAVMDVQSWENGPVPTMTVTYTDGSTREIPVTAEYLRDADGNRVDTSVATTYSDLQLSYYGVTCEQPFTLHITKSDLPDYPDYPEPGSVIIDKTASGVNFQSSGLAKVELSTNGIPAEKGADVIIMLDTSSSMNGKSDQGTETRINILCESLNNLLNTFQQKRPDGTDQDIRVAIADFNGNYTDPASPYYLDPNDTIKQGSARILDTGKNNKVFTSPKTTSGAYTNTKGADSFVRVQELGQNPFTTAHNYKGETAALHTLQYHSGTNYDYAFDAIYELGQSINDANAAANENRDLYVIFMSDGVPFQYNYFSSYRKPNWTDWVLGTFTQEMYATHANQSYYNPEGRHWMAEAIKGSPSEEFQVIRKNDPRDVDCDNWITVNGLGATMYSIGFCIKNDQDNEEDVNKVTAETAKEVLRKIGSKESMVSFPNTAAELTDTFNAIAGDIMYAISDASFIDTMGPQFSLQMGNHDYQLKGTATTFTDNKIQVTQYEIWLPDDYENGLCTLADVGSRKPASDEYPKVLETVTFNADGTEAYSDVLGSDVNILTGGLISASTFWYNANSTATTITLDTGKTYSLPAETFYWKVGSIDTKEMALSYYAYLDGSMEGQREPGSYDTNTSAVLYYENYLGNDCQLPAPVPNMSWGGGQAGYGFYLVNHDGTPITASGQPTSFALASKIGSVTYQTFALNSDGASIVATDVLRNVLPTEYNLFDLGARYDVYLNSDGAGGIRVFSDEEHVDSTGTPIQSTYIMGLTDTPILQGDINGAQLLTTEYETDNTVVWFAVTVDDTLLNDTIIIDYGLDVNIHPHTNDTIMNGGNADMLGIAKDESSTLGMQNTTVNLEHGKVTFKSYNSTDPSKTYFTYRLNDMQMDSEDTFVYSIQYNGSTVNGTEWNVIPKGQYYRTVTIIPATTLYYEDNFVSYTTYETIKDTVYKSGETGYRGTSATPVSDGWTPRDTANAPSGNAWQVDGTVTNAVQEENRLGDSITNAEFYGSDNAYNECATYSMNSAMWLHAGFEPNTAAGMEGTYTYTSGTAEFTFWGTGFDVISKTSSKTGVIMVRVYDADTGASVKNYMVDTYYGYTTTYYRITNTFRYNRWITTAEKQITKAEMKTDQTPPTNPKAEDSYYTYETRVEPDTSANGALYQVPVIKVDDLNGYGHYKVVITASYNYLFNHGQYGAAEGYDFCLDAIRIYNPAGDGIEKDADGNVTSTVVQDAYIADGEGWPTYVEIRDILLSAAEYDALGTASVNGAIFIDSNAALTDGSASGLPGTENTTTSKSAISDYANFGPNNELYLAKGQAVAFTFAKNDNVAQIHVGMKTVGGSGIIKISNSGSSKSKNFNINTATDVTWRLSTNYMTNGYTVTIENVGSSVISLTNLWFTHKSDPMGVSASNYLLVNHDTGAQAMSAMGIELKQIVQPTLKLSYPTLSFEDEIVYNVYFSAENLDSVEEMGLLTFNTNEVEGTVDNCTGNYPAALDESGLYMASTDGIAAKTLGDTVWFRAYAKLTNGDLVYSKMYSYSAKQYAQSQLAGSDDTIKPLVVAMLNYGAAAQELFGYRTDALVNADLTADQKALAAAYSSDMIAGVNVADADKVGDFGKSGGFTRKYPTVSFEGAFAINYYLVPANAVDGEMTLYLWDQAAYDGAEVLTADNATRILPMTLNEAGEYTAAYTGIAAKDLNGTIYASAVYESNGVRCSTGMIPYTAAAYCKTFAEDSNSAMNAIARATVVYGHHATAYFTKN